MRSSACCRYQSDSAIRRLATRVRTLETAAPPDTSATRTDPEQLVARRDDPQQSQRPIQSVPKTLSHAPNSPKPIPSFADCHLFEGPRPAG